jgi:hypothetical protein
MFHIHRPTSEQRFGDNLYQICRCGAGRVVRAARGRTGAVSPVAPGWPVPAFGASLTSWVPGPFPEVQEKPVRPPRGGAGVSAPARGVQITVLSGPTAGHTFARDALPVDAHILAAQIDDALRIWTTRGPTYHPDVARAAQTAVRRYNLLVDVLSKARNQLERELEEYRP